MLPTPIYAQPVHQNENNQSNMSINDDYKTSKIQIDKNDCKLLAFMATVLKVYRYLQKKYSSSAHVTTQRISECRVFYDGTADQ